MRSQSRSGGGIDPDTGNVFIFCSVKITGGARQSAGFLKSTDHGATFGAYTNVSSELPSTDYLPFGPMLKTSNGLMQGFYIADQACVLFSSDGGNTWGNRVTVFSGQTGLVETTFVSVDEDRIVGIIRDQLNQDSYRYIKSSDGGSTWGTPSAPFAWTALTIGAAAPCFATKHRSQILIAWGGRTPDWEIHTNRVGIEDFWSNPENGWAIGAPNRIDNVYTATATINTDFGYCWIAPFSEHPMNALVTWYDDDGASGKTSAYYITLGDL